MPYLKFSVLLNVPPETAVAGLAAAAADGALRGRTGASADHPALAGWVHGTEFKLQRVIHERIQSFVPVVRGRVLSAPGGSRLEGVMRLHVVVAIFMLVWVGGMLTVTARATDDMVPVVMVAGFLVIGLTSFYSEARTTRRLLVGAAQGGGGRAAA